MKNMTIQEFTSAQTDRLTAFREHWFTTVYPSLDEDDKHFWDYEANMWDWAEAYDNWRDSK